MKTQIDLGHIEIARSLMKDIMYANGMVNRWRPEKYPKKHVNRIAKSAGIFFDAHPEFLTDDDILNMADGFVEENQEKYGIYPEYKQLSDDLNEYFDPGSTTLA